MKKYWLGIIGALAGFLYAQIYPLPYFKIDSNLDIVELATLAATIFIAFWLSKVVPHEEEINRAEKNLFLKWSDEINSNIKVFSSRCKDGVIKLTDVTSACKQISININSLFETLVDNQYAFEPTKTTLLLGVSTIKDILTTTPVGEKVDKEIIVANGIVSVNGSKLQNLTTEFEKLKKNFFKFQIALNKK